MRFTLALLVCCGLLAGLYGPAAAETRTETVKFAAGTTGATLTGELGSEDAVRYVLGAGDQQYLSVSLRPDNQLTYYIIYVPDGGILFESSQGGNAYYDQLSASGDHVVEVFYKGEPGTVGKYDIAFEITSDPQDGAAATPPPATEPPDPNAVTVAACLTAVAKETGESDVAALSSEFSEANSMVVIGVGPDRAPWNCLVSNDGNVEEVSFAGDEGAL